MRRILLPTDFSDNSLDAIQYALLIFKNLKCSFYLLHTYMPPIYNSEYLIGSPGQIGLGDVIQETSKTQLEDLKSRLENQYDNPKHSFIVHTAFNTLLNEVIETLVSENIDLVVMGTQGATGAQEILFGTNTSHVIKKAKCPVLAVPPKFKYEALKDILFPTDYEIGYGKEKFKLLITLARQHRSRIHVMHVSTGNELSIVQKNHKEDLQKLLGDNTLLHDTPNDSIITAINAFLAKEQIDLLVMVQNKHTFFERLFIEPIIKKISFHIRVPFLVIPQL
ncbi:MAG TPA: universal stress protein [Aquaticitalea sp.]|nr:universal stress protein [Aquaticitalea sp.]